MSLLIRSTSSLGYGTGSTHIANPLPKVHETAIGQIYAAGRRMIKFKLPTGIARLLNKAARQD
ncbi:MAG: hypothetical protein AUH15_10050 [Acidobacteriales bacterium 13_2_20CM_55_8]|nr:MAG: hypothetical protein AUH15_10050 [Acidobacteriales bacterium 13_2_20CM_55_8]